MGEYILQIDVIALNYKARFLQRISIYLSNFCRIIQLVEVAKNVIIFQFAVALGARKKNFNPLWAGGGQNYVR